MASDRPHRKVQWVASARDDLRGMSTKVRGVIGYALHLAQRGETHLDAKKMRGDLHDVMEIVVSDAGNAYRTMYTVKFRGVVYVLHVFQKKSKKGAATPKPDLNLIRTRLRTAKKHYEEHYASATRAEITHTTIRRWAT